MTELTVAMLQLAASGRGIAILPFLAAQGYLDRAYVSVRWITPDGLSCRLYGACASALSQQAYFADFIRVVRESSFLSIPRISLLGMEEARSSLGG